MTVLVQKIASLREHCPWMGALTHESLVEYLIEEAYEVVDSIEAGASGSDTSDELRGELGDVLLQVVLHARLAEEQGRFTFDDVARAITEKMVRRNPHVFRPDGSLQDSFPATVEEIVEKWDAVKKAEKPERSDPFEGIPPHLPALALAQKSLDRAERAARSGGPERPGRPVAAVEVPDSEAALGDLLLAVVAGSKEKGFDAERALRAAVRRYQGRDGGAT
ncbi:MazG nucleotide pyrophosphohydrolase domain-containing protein [Arthrobacter sp. MMS18-M83]|uniref:MazG nucleotide pyrophosphohydrolase domain-containing protein n=1 Tax=Arthrobacter sp. MMS18-M83 TaxID=2996261 RepID=UPI00227ACB5C|nr:MazG nucleotide pyrophosphohydrolase domain-containing protein [Arthrobacter sp. MMS18-M83]WAH98747.1 nucleotide pyrophosphohydrolase [Arthrobacter sp. MMS18-M83]